MKYRKTLTPEIAMANYKKAYLETQQKLRSSEKRSLELQCERDAYLITVKQLTECMHKMFNGATIKIVQTAEKN